MVVAASRCIVHSKRSRLPNATAMTRCRKTPSSFGQQRRHPVQRDRQFAPAIRCFLGTWKSRNLVISFEHCSEQHPCSARRYCLPREFRRRPDSRAHVRDNVRTCGANPNKPELGHEPHRGGQTARASLISVSRCADEKGGACHIDWIEAPRVQALNGIRCPACPECDSHGSEPSNS